MGRATPECEPQATPQATRQKPRTSPAFFLPPNAREALHRVTCALGTFVAGKAQATLVIFRQQNRVSDARDGLNHVANSLVMHCTGIRSVPRRALGWGEVRMAQPVHPRRCRRGPPATRSAKPTLRRAGPRSRRRAASAGQPPKQASQLTSRVGVDGTSVRNSAQPRLRRKSSSRSTQRSA
jgi:hypothetical protein